MTTTISCLERYKLDITAIQEVRWEDAGHITSQGMTMFYSGGTKHERGVGFIVKDRIMSNIVNFKSINDRLCILELKCKWYNVIMINCYAPTEDKHDDIKTVFYDELEILYDSLPNWKPKIVIGDFNAKIGKETMYRPTIGKESLHRETNENGSMLVTFASNKNMVVSSTMFPHKNIHKQTWMSPCGRIKNQIDYVLVDNRIRSSVTDIRSMRGSSAISDHFLVRVKIHFRISVEKQRRISGNKRINRDILKTNVVKLYQDRLNEELQRINQESDINNTWEKVVQVIKDTSERIWETHKV